MQTEQNTSVTTWNSLSPNKNILTAQENGFPGNEK